MDITLLLSQIFGFYLVIGGVAVITRRSYFAPLIGAIAEEKLTRLVVSILEIFGGLLLVTIHNDWSTFAAGIVTLFGWVLLLEGIFYLFAPDKVVADLIKGLNVTWWYIVGGVVSIALGLYLLNTVFAWVA